MSGGSSNSTTGICGTATAAASPRATRILAFDGRRDAAVPSHEHHPIGRAAIASKERGDEGFDGQNNTTFWPGEGCWPFPKRAFGRDGQALISVRNGGYLPRIRCELRSGASLPSGATAVTVRPACGTSLANWPMPCAGSTVVIEPLSEGSPMRTNTSFQRLEPHSSPMLALIFFLVFPPLCRAHDGIAKRAAQPQAKPALKVGIQVVLKTSDTPLDDNGKAISIKDNLRTWIEKIDGERVLLVVSDVMKAGWVRSEQVLPRDESLARMLATCVDASIRAGKRSVAEATAEPQSAGSSAPTNSHPNTLGRAIEFC